MKQYLMLLIFTASLFIPTVSSAKRYIIRTSEMLDDVLAHLGLEELIEVVGKAELKVTALKQALKQHQLHLEGADAAGLLIEGGADGVTFLPKFPWYTRYNGVYVYEDDSDTHTLLHKDAIIDLQNNNFFNTGVLLRLTADTAIHELLHAMVFRTQCFKGDDEQLVQLISGDIVEKIAIYKYVLAGNMNRAQQNYTKLVSDVATQLSKNQKWKACYGIVGLPGPFPTVPASKTLVFHSNRNGNYDVYKIDTDTKELKPITSNPADELVQTPRAWSLDGSRIVFERSTSSGGEIHIKDIAEPTDTETPKITDGATPDWSPDGQKLVFMRNNSIYTIQTNGQGELPLHAGSYPQWSTQNKIAFEEIIGDRFDVGIINPDGTGLITFPNFLSSPGQNPNPRWSPDGSKLAFIRIWNNGCGTDFCHATIYTVNADGSNLIPIVELSGTVSDKHLNRLSWAPDGQRLAFANNGGLNIVNVDGSGLKPITPETGDIDLGDFSPAWSPDGTQLAYVFFNAQINSSDIFLIKTDGTGTPQNVTNSPNSQNFFPFWKPQ